MKTIIYSVAALTLITGPVVAINSDDHRTPHWVHSEAQSSDYWADLHESFASCKRGVDYSPFDIISEFGSEKSIQTYYNYTPLDITNNGQAIQVNYEKGSYFNVSGQQYDLKQSHFYSPSENNIDEQSQPLELHLVHTDAAGEIAVVAVLFEEGYENAYLKDVWGNMPKEANGHARSEHVRISATDVIPNEFSVTVFDGSLETSSCSEGVKWHVIETPLEASKGQIKDFLTVIQKNNRPVQAYNKSNTRYSGQ